MLIENKNCLYSVFCITSFYPHVLVGTTDRTYVSLSAPTFHCCVVVTRYEVNQSVSQRRLHRTIWLLSVVETDTFSPVVETGDWFGWGLLSNGAWKGGGGGRNRLWKAHQIIAILSSVIFVMLG